MTSALFAIAILNGSHLYTIGKDFADVEVPFTIRLDSRWKPGAGKDVPELMEDISEPSFSVQGRVLLTVSCLRSFSLVRKSKRTYLLYLRHGKAHESFRVDGSMGYPINYSLVKLYKHGVPKAWHRPYRITVYIIRKDKIATLKFSCENASDEFKELTRSAAKGFRFQPGAAVK